MGVPKPARPVCLFCGIIYHDEAAFGTSREILKRHFGPIAIEDGPFIFNFTDYYTREMGTDLKRKFVAFERPVDPSSLSSIKLLTNKIEDSLGSIEEGVSKRTVNMDPGYLDAARVVLATTKNCAHRIYLGNGIYAEITLLFRHGSWNHLDWTYPDYRTNEYHEFFDKVRRLYLAAISKE